MAFITKKTLICFTLTLSILALVLILFESYLRQEVAHVINKSITESGGWFEADPEFLVQYTSRGRRLVSNADVIIRNHYISKKDIEIKTNSLGLRSSEITNPKSPRELRVLVLGDSITMGDYLNSEEIYVTRIEHYLKTAMPEITIHVINAGITNVGIEEERIFLKELLPKVQPDLVVFGFYLNDSRPPWGFSGEIGNRGWLRRHSILFETIYTNLSSRNWTKERQDLRFSWIKEQKNLNWKEKPEDLIKLAKLAQYDWGAAWEDSSWNVVNNEFAQIKALAQEHHFKVLILSFPVSFQVYADFFESNPQHRLKEISLAHEFSFLDLLPLLRNYKGQNSDLSFEMFFDHCHPKEITNDYIGKEVAAFLEKEGSMFNHKVR